MSQADTTDRHSALRDTTRLERGEGSLLRVKRTADDTPADKVKGIKEAKDTEFKETRGLNAGWSGKQRKKPPG